MAIDTNGLKLLCWAKSLGFSFRKTLTLGRQGIIFNGRELRRVASQCGLKITAEEVEQCFRRRPMTGCYADGLFPFLGAEEVVTVDRSSFEGANFLHDLNEPFPAGMHGTFDMVIDGGTLEHIFDLPRALRHCMDLVKVDGHLIMVTAPANSLMGHGFYQLSPEFFFRAFEPENGFRIEKIVIYSALGTHSRFFEITDPKIYQGRVELADSRPMHIAVIAKKIAEKEIFKITPQQSDYAKEWELHENKTAEPQKRSGVIWELRKRLNPYWPIWLRQLRSGVHSIGKGRTNTLSNASAYRQVLPNEFKTDSSGQR